MGAPSAGRLPVVALMGPTASGKSQAALALAERFPVEILSVDSAQVYRGMDLGTAKPSAAERAQVPHHLLDLLEPTERYSAAQFAADAQALIDAVHARGRIPLLVGGTMLYFKALREGLSPLPAADPVLRQRIEQAAAERGWPALHADLGKVDPLTAARLEPRDAQRIQRALEVFELTGAPLSAWLQRAQAAPAHRSPWVQIALVPSERAGLHARIARRFAQMLEAGLVEEVRALRSRHPGLSAELPSMRAVGYRQVWIHLEGGMSRKELADRGIFATRQLAKRQITWLRQTPDLVPVDALAADAPAQVIDALAAAALPRRVDAGQAG
jgi:tRNA dimethylallyltransferase